MSILARLRARLARWLLPTIDGETVYPDTIAIGSGEGTGIEGAVEFGWFAFETGGERIFVAMPPEAARRAGHDLLDVADDIEGVPGESIDIEETGNRGSR